MASFSQRLRFCSLFRARVTRRCRVAAGVEQCVVVNEGNEVVGSAPRRELVAQRMLGRGSYVLLRDCAGRLFVSKRSERKDVYPGKLDVVISGVVCAGESYKQTAVRELAEEVGIPEGESDSALEELFTFRYSDAVCDVWGCVFQCRMSGTRPVQLVDGEVEWGQFLDMEEVKRRLEESGDDFTPVGRRILQEWNDRDGCPSTLS